MELTDEQYNKIFRYVDGEMSTEEQIEFETLLLQNKQLSEEAIFYRELRSISESLAQKISGTNLLQTEERANEENSISP